MGQKVQLILWGPLIKTTIGLYLIVILLAAVFPPAATILMFAILCLWSRVPCMLSNFTKDMDVIDFFAVLLAVNLGGLFAGIFGFVLMWFSRIFGPAEDLEYTLKESITFFIAGLLTPFFYILTGKNILLTMYCFTLFGRYGVYLIQDLIVSPGLFWLDLGYIAVGIPIAYFSNTILISIFGDGLDRLFDSGLQLSGGLLIFMTIVVICFYVIGKMIAQTGEQMIEDDETTFKEAIQSIEPHDVIMSYFDIDELPEIIKGTAKGFRIKIFLLTTALLIVLIFSKGYTPIWYEIIFIVIIFYAIIHGLLSFFSKLTVK